MSEQGAQVLLEKIRTDADFRRRLEEAPTVEEKERIVRAAGFDVAPAELPALLEAAADESEISDGELEKVAGGLGDATEMFDSTRFNLTI